MIKDLVPNWLRVILCILSFASFFPQLHRIWTRKDSAGISPYYVLFNLVSATEQFTLGFFYLVNYFEDSDFFIHNPRTTGDWLNLAQLLVIWIMSLTLFVACLHYSPVPDVPKGLRVRVLAIYVSFLLISVVPVFVDAISPVQGDGRRWLGAVFFYVHSTLINPIATMMGISSLFVQMSRASALSFIGLVSQVVVVALVALSWTARVNFPVLDRLTLNVLITWYTLVGWAAVDNAVFATVQLVLLCMAKHRGRVFGDHSVRPEEEPLLAH
ncbi:MAG: hypothetical protein M1818_007329 [Claussenomyces sp. TS43310]|nr:MAG: hypothetical protein M1818_007329 [Claussenomyces sp. TS43310]